jgi:hypothetical protein
VRVGLRGISPVILRVILLLDRVWLVASTISELSPPYHSQAFGLMRN